MIDQLTTEEAARIRAEERSCFDRLRGAVAPEQRRALVAQMAELQERAAELELEELKRRRSAGQRAG
jgi:hypothetical protein